MHREPLNLSIGHRYALTAAHHRLNVAGFYKTLNHIVVDPPPVGEFLNGLGFVAVCAGDDVPVPYPFRIHYSITIGKGNERPSEAHR